MICDKLPASNIVRKGLVWEAAAWRFLSAVRWLLTSGRDRDGVSGGEW
jgi:hypothetical protein